MSLNFLSFFSIVKNSLTLSNLSDALNGFGRSNSVNYINDYTQAMYQGASPNVTMVTIGQTQSAVVAGSNMATLIHSMSWTRTSWLVTPFLMLIPLITVAWPRNDKPNTNFNTLMLFCSQTITDLSQPELQQKMRWRIICNLLRFLHFILRHMPVIQSNYIKRTFNFINKHILTISTMITIAAYIGLFFYGFPVLSIVGGATLLYGLLDRNNLAPLFLRHFVKKWGLPISLAATLITGNPIEMIFGLIGIPVLYGHYFKNPLIRLLRRFNSTQEFANTLAEQERQVRTFDFQSSANQFEESLHEIQSMDFSIIKAHVLDNNMLLPPQQPGVNLDDLLTLFNGIDWTQNQSRVLELNRQIDWQLLRAQGEAATDNNQSSVLSPQEQYNNDINYLRTNLTTFIQRVRTDDIHSVRHGAEDLVKRYTQGIISILNNIKEKSQRQGITERERAALTTTLIDVLIRLGYETGQYCGIGLLRAVETNYRSLFSDSSRRLTLKERVRFIHQMHREFFYQQAYVKLSLNQADDKRDTHAYGRSIVFHASRLGLPANFAENDEINDIASPLLRDLLSAFSPIEKIFWDNYISVDRLKQQIRSACNTPLLPIAEVDEWYHHFIDAHVTGTDEEKEALKEQSPYHVEMHGAVPIFSLKESILNLMLLDFGVIALPNTPGRLENQFRPSGAAQQVQPQNPPAITHSLALWRSSRARNRPNHVSSQSQRINNLTP